MEQTKKKSIFDTRIKSANVGLGETFFGFILGPLFGLMAYGICVSNQTAYWRDTLGIEGNFLTILPLISIIFIVIGNIVVGQLIDRCKSKHGKARPFILISAVLLSAASFLFFSVPKIENTAVMMIWIAVAYNLYYAVAYPLYYTSNSLMISLSTRNGKQRGLLSSVLGLAQTGASAGGPLVLNIVLDVFKASPTVYLVSIIILGALTFLAVGLQYYFTRERVTEENIKLGIVKEKIPLAKQLKAVVTNKYWWMIILFYLFFQLSGQMQNGTLKLYNDYVFGGYGNSFTYTILQIVPGVVLGAGVVFSWPLASKIGKKNASCIGLIVASVGCALALIVSLTGQLTTVYSLTWWLQLVSIVCIRLGMGPPMYVMMALFADVLDHIEAKNGFRCDGFSMSLYSIIMATMASATAGIYNALLTASGYQSGVMEGNVLNETIYAANQASSNAVISWCFLGFMMLGYLVCLAVILFLNVEKNVDKERKQIRERQKAEVLASGGVWIEPEERLRLEQEETDRVAEEARKSELKAKCEKTGLNYEQEEAKYQAKLAAKQTKKKN